jgi:hypothetical protein
MMLGEGRLAGRPDRLVRFAGTGAVALSLVFAAFAVGQIATWPPTSSQTERRWRRRRCIGRSTSTASGTGCEGRSRQDRGGRWGGPAGLPPRRPYTSLPHVEVAPGRRPAATPGVRLGHGALGARSRRAARLSRISNSSKSNGARRSRCARLRALTGGSRQRRPRRVSRRLGGRWMPRSGRAVRWSHDSEGPDRSGGALAQALGGLAWPAGLFAAFVPLVVRARRRRQLRRQRPHRRPRCRSRTR